MIFFITTLILSLIIEILFLIKEIKIFKNIKFFNYLTFKDYKNARNFQVKNIVFILISIFLIIFNIFRSLIIFEPYFLYLFYVVGDRI